jgi:hypothetical protein
MSKPGSVLLFAVLVLAGCSASIDSKPPVGIIPPELAIRQLGGAGVAASQVTGPTPVNFRIQVYNPSSEDIELQRVELQTVGYGAYTISNASRPFDKPIPSNKTIEVDTWISAYANDTIIGVNGPATLRVTAYFKSPFGAFKQVYTKEVNRDLSPLPKPNN